MSEASNPRQKNFSDPTPLIDFEEMYYLLRRKAWFVVLCIVLAGLCGGTYILRSPKIYAAKTVVQVDQAQHRVVNIQAVTSEDLGSTDLLKTIEQNLASAAIMEAVVESLHLTPQSLGGTGKVDAGKSNNDVIRQVSDSVKVNLVRGTRLISIVAESTQPELAQHLSLEVVKQYIRRTFDERLGISREANKFLMEEAQRLKEKLQKSEQALQAYKEQTQAVSLEDTQNIIVAKLKEINVKVTEAKTARLKLESDYAQVKRIGTAKPEELLGLPSVAESKAVLEQKKSVAEQEASIANLSQRYGPLHPKLIQAQSQLQELKAGLNRAIVSSAESTGTLYEAAKDTEIKFEQALKEQEQKALELNKLAIPYNVLAREVESDKALYESVLTRMKETDVTKSLEQDNIRIVEPARLPEKAIKPRRSVVLAGSLLLGLLTGVGLVLGLNSLDKSLKTVDQAETRLHLPAVGAVPKADKPISVEEGLLIIREPHGSVAEAFRTLRTALSLLGKESERRTFLFTSAVPGEGKSFCSINYSVALAQQGLRTLLIDADLRLPTVGKIFFGAKTHAGVSDVISGQKPFDEGVQTSDIEGFSIMTAGNRAPNPAELLGGMGFGELVREALTKFDRVVIDSAPVNAVSDSLLLVKHVQSVCLVVQAGRTPDKAVIRACNKLQEAGGKPVGFILNRLPAHAGVGYYYHYSAGEYGKGVYGAVETAKA